MSKDDGTLSPCTLDNRGNFFGVLPEMSKDDGTLSPYTLDNRGNYFGVMSYKRQIWKWRCCRHQRELTEGALSL